MNDIAHKHSDFMEHFHEEELMEWKDTNLVNDYLSEDLWVFVFFLEAKINQFDDAIFSAKRGIKIYGEDINFSINSFFLKANH